MDPQDNLHIITEKNTFYKNGKKDRVPTIVRLVKELLHVSESRDCVALEIEFCDLVMTSSFTHSCMCAGAREFKFCYLVFESLQETKK